MYCILNVIWPIDRRSTRLGICAPPKQHNQRLQNYSVSSHILVISLFRFWPCSGGADGRTDGGVKTCLKRREPLTGKKGISDSGGHHQPKKLLPGRILGKKTCMLQFSLTDNGLSKLATSDYRWQTTVSQELPIRAHDSPRSVIDNRRSQVLTDRGLSLEIGGRKFWKCSPNWQTAVCHWKLEDASFFLAAASGCK